MTVSISLNLHQSLSPVLNMLSFLDELHNGMNLELYYR